MAPLEAKLLGLLSRHSPWVVFNWPTNIIFADVLVTSLQQRNSSEPTVSTLPFILPPEMNNSTKLVPYTILVSIWKRRLVNLVLTKNLRSHFLRICFPKLPEWVHQRTFLPRSRHHRFLLKPLRAVRLARELFPNLPQNLHFPSLPEEWKQLLTSESADIFHSKTQQTRSCRMCEKWLKKARNGQRSQVDRRHNLTFPVPLIIFQQKSG